MTTIMAAPDAEPVGKVLTPEEYDALPENSRRELVDGVIHMMASPTSWHQFVKDGLVIALRSRSPRGLIVLSEEEIRLRALLRRIPDIVLVRRGAYRRDKSRYAPEEVAVVVEVVSPGSESIDRMFKPIEYATAGIEHYWRVEIDPEVTVNTFRLANGTYRPTGAFSGSDTVNAPGVEWAQIKVAELGDDE